MAGLGYERYGAQGGDWGSMISTQLGLADPEHVVGVHLNMVVAPPPADLDFEHLQEDEQVALATYEYYGRVDSGYSKIQGTKPQTIGYALDDSPAGLAGWIVEKFRTWSDCDGDVERRFTKDQLLDNVMLYWLTGTAHSAGTPLLRGRADPELRGRLAGSRCPSGSPRSRRRSSARRGVGPNRGTTSGSGPKCREEDISRRSRSPSCWSRTSGSSSGPYGSLSHCARASSLGSTRATACVKM